MVVQETFDLDGRTLCRTYSNADMNVHKIDTDEVYEEAIDIFPCPYAYEEIEKPIEEEDNPEEDEQSS